MRKTAMLIIVLFAVAAMGTTCDNGSSSSGGGFGASSLGPASPTNWDMLYMVTGSTVCTDLMPARGMSLPLSALPIGGSPPPSDALFAPSAVGDLLPDAVGMFPGVRVVSDGTNIDGKIPEVHGLTYYLMDELIVPTAAYPLGIIQPGSKVKVHFQYRTMADGQDGDYFLVRITDGDRFLVPAHVRGTAMADQSDRSVNFAYTATDSTFALQFIFGLSSADDAIELDDVSVQVGATPLIVDTFESGDYVNVSYLGPVARVPSFPYGGVGSMALASPLVPLEGLSLLEVDGGRYFELGGLAASLEGFSGAIFTFFGDNPADGQPNYRGDASTASMGSILFGQYNGYTDDTPPHDCQEVGTLLVSKNVQGNADLSGWWGLSIDAECDDGSTMSSVMGLLVGDTSMQVARVQNFFMSWPFTDLGGNGFSMQGFSMGNAGLMLLQADALPAGAQLAGVYDPSTGTFAGQIFGLMQTPLGGACVINQGKGTFYATIDNSHYVYVPAF